MEKAYNVMEIEDMLEEKYKKIRANKSGMSRNFNKKNATIYEHNTKYIIKPTFNQKEMS